MNVQNASQPRYYYKLIICCILYNYKFKFIFLISVNDELGRHVYLSRLQNCDPFLALKVCENKLRVENHELL